MRAGAVPGPGGQACRGRAAGPRRGRRAGRRRRSDARWPHADVARGPLCDGPPDPYGSTPPRVRRAGGQSWPSSMARSVTGIRKAPRSVASPVARLIEWIRLFPLTVSVAHPWTATERPSRTVL